MVRQAGSASDSTPHALEDALPLLRAHVALEQLQAVREHREQIVEVVRDTPCQLADRFHFLGLTKRLLGMSQPLLIAQALGHVIDELVGADAFAVRSRKVL